jgi:fructose/tagatose bisphosphate aldolase
VRRLSCDHFWQGLSALGGTRAAAGTGRHQRTMIMDTLRNVLSRLQRQGAAVGHFNVANLVLLKAVVAAAVEVGASVIVGASEGERDFLHGGSGTDDEDLLRAIAAGINIIHISTELRVAWRGSLEGSLTSQPNEVVPYKILSPVVDSVRQVASSRLKLFDVTSEQMHLSSGR